MTNADSAETPVIVLRRRRARPLFGRHPWVFAGAIERIDNSATEEPEPGTLVQVQSHNGEFVAWGLFNGLSNIRVRLYSWDPARPVTGAMIRDRVAEAVNCRRSRFDLNDVAAGCRLVFSESDQLSGLTVDWYGGFALVQFTSRALYQFRDAVIEALHEQLQPRGVWLRTEKGMREAEGLEIVDGLVNGDVPPRPLFIQEGELQFGIDVQQGQKTGFYLDQRENRRAVAPYTQGHKVLDAFCFSGGFGIAAVRLGEAASSLGIDSSEAAIQLAEANADLNGVGGRCEFRKGDVKVVLGELAEQGRTFDTVILDPPRMARTRGGVDRALRGYERLNLQGLNVLRPGGILVSCSCSGLVSREQFQAMLGNVSRQSGRHMRILEFRGQPSDHPVSAVCPETEYLKVCICRVD